MRCHAPNRPRDMALDDYHRYVPLTEIADEFRSLVGTPTISSRRCTQTRCGGFTSGDLKYTRAAAPWDANGSAR